MEPLTINPKQSKLRVAPEWADVCFTCGTCASGCPVTGVDGMDPRKGCPHGGPGTGPGVDRLALSRGSAPCAAVANTPVPQGVEILKMLRRARTLRERDKVPGPIHKGVVMDLNRGNNLGIPRTTFFFFCRPGQGNGRGGIPGFYVPVDKKGRQRPCDHQLQGALRRAGRHEVLVEDFLCRQGRLDGPFPQLGRRQLGSFFRGRRVHEDPGGPDRGAHGALECKTLLLPE
jgi:ferredoxin